MLSILKNDSFWTGVVASAALAVGAVVLLGKLAPDLLTGRATDRLSPSIVVVDPNALMLKVAALPQGANDPKTVKALLDQSFAELSEEGLIVLDKRAVLSAPKGVEIEEDIILQHIAETAPYPKLKVPALETKSVAERDASRPALKLDLTEEQLKSLAKKPQSEEDLKKTAEAINQIADLLEQMQAMEKLQGQQ